MTPSTDEITPDNDPDNDNAGVKIPPPIILIFWLIISYFLTRILALSFPISRTLLGAIGGTCLIISIVIKALSVMSFRKHKTSIIPDRPSTFLMTNGIFKYSRNPIYLSFCLAFFSLSLLLNSPMTLLFLPIVFLWLRYSVIAKEEAYLARHFGTAYIDYTRQTRRWL